MLRPLVAALLLASVVACAGTPSLSPDAQVLGAFMRFRRAWLERDAAAIRAQTADSSRWFRGEEPLFEHAEILDRNLEPLGVVTVRVRGDAAEVDNLGDWPSRFRFVREGGAWAFQDLTVFRDIAYGIAGYDLPISEQAEDYGFGSEPHELWLVLLADGDLALGGERRTRPQVLERIRGLAKEAGAPPAVRLLADRDQSWIDVADVLSWLAAEAPDVTHVSFATRYPDRDTRWSQGTVYAWFPPQPPAPSDVSILVTVRGHAGAVPDLSRIAELLREAPPALREKPVILDASPDLPWQAVVTTVEGIREADAATVVFARPEEPRARPTPTPPQLAITAVPLDADAAARLIVPAAR